jgi:hypothetical protein
MAKKILQKRSLVANTVPTINELDLGELAVNAYEGRLYLKRSYLDLLGDATEEVIEIGGRIPVENTLFVTESGDDNRFGTSWEESFATIERAVEVATERGELCLIDVGPGVYFTQGHIDVPDNTIIKCVHRTAIMKPEPGYEERNVFRLGSGCFLEGFLFEGFRVNDLDNPTEGFAVSFRPGAVITRAPYAHKIACRAIPTWDYVAPPLDRNNANPLVPIGGGVALADGSVCSPYSIYPNIMTWGATPVVHNGIGYCAKNGALINAVNAVSLWAHKHFYAIDGGQIILSACSTQFGDYTLVSKGSRSLPNPIEIEDVQVVNTILYNPISVTVNNTDVTTINSAKTTIINNMWNALVADGLTTGWTLQLEQFTKRDAGTLLNSIMDTLRTGNIRYMINFTKSLFISGAPVFASDKLEAFVYCFNSIDDQLQELNISSNSKATIASVINTLNTIVQFPTYLGASLSVQTAAATAITNAKTTIINNLWTSLVTNGYTTGWTQTDETFTRRDANNLLQCLIWVLQTANEKPIIDFAKGLFNTNGTKIYDLSYESAFFYGFNYMREQIRLIVSDTAAAIVDGLITTLTDTLTRPVLRIEPSTITAVGHTFTGVLAGVALTKIPPVRNQANIQDSILEIGQGVVIASGQDDQGSAIFVGGLEINADTGELGGPPFEQAVNRIATKTAIARSF